MTTRLYNPEHKSKIMTEADKLPKFDDKYKVLAIMHATDFSTGELDGSNTNARRSEYKQEKGQHKCKCGKEVTSANKKHTKCLSRYKKTFDKCACSTLKPPQRSKYPGCASPSTGL